MKLLIVTAVEAFEKDVLRLFKAAHIEQYSEADIDGYKNIPTKVSASSWFPSEKNGAASSLFFSFTADENIDALFTEIRKYNKNLESNNPIRAVVVPIERAI